MYSTIFAISTDPYLRNRLAAAVALEGIDVVKPEEWVQANRWRIATQPGWAASWESALAAERPDPNAYTPGNDETVITDAMILSAVQAVAAR